METTELNTESSKYEHIKSLIGGLDNTKDLFFSTCRGFDIPFYDKECIAEGDFSWSCKELGYTVFVNPLALYDSKVNSDKFMFSEESGEDS